MNRSLLKGNALLFEWAMRLLDPLLVGVVGGIIFRVYVDDWEQLTERYTLAILGMCLVCAALFPFLGLYAPQRGVSMFEELRRLFNAWMLMATTWFAFLFLSIGNYGNTLDIFQSTNPDAAAQSKSQLGNREGMGVRHIAFAVETEEDLKQAYFALQDAGVPIYRAVDHTSQKSVYFYDPDDNLLEIVWERPNVREIFAKGRHDGDQPVTFER